AYHQYRVGFHIPTVGRFQAEKPFFCSLYAGPIVDRSRKGDYGVARDRLVALKGDRLQPTPPADVIADDGGQGPSLVQEDARQPSSTDPPVGIADGASKPLRPSSEDAGHYSLASAANPVADPPHSAPPLLAPAA